ncbi:6-pyruvoyl tetrahydrobiopterin synthase [Dermatophilus congolensis]|uniref:6-pyruvoyl tetrahydrobiopterin synthase n=1 Tax=Dermatophilus congolensis TaxID=1863 RepID=UPI001AAE458C|nr:6-pyruvoyl tetrahydrobiopterin synthase [Dermatophilus congolensis]MBO3129118.1 hypothetical protein [Dermatophilus congolensis]MBO3132245.1 hypothetical protein [Dermatophilus congolensis]MBO3133594.1 hypothetical protein [Dermatophilus congolensis]MBO3135827.1 hypothetical protein [Dermatophilus congolensis]MBO3138070.1 hypothetical protein [Dermatophilus congolensis]
MRCGFWAVTAALGLSVLVAPVALAAPDPGSRGGVHGLGPVGTATMHGDAQSSDTTPNPGPGSRGVRSVFSGKQAACPTVLADREGMVWSLCTQIANRAPVVNLLDSTTGATLASMPVAKGALLGGVYAYVDNQNRLVMVDGKHRLLKIGKSRAGNGSWVVSAAQSYDISAFVTAGGADSADAVVGLAPDRRGRIWLATRQGKVGVFSAGSAGVKSLRLGVGERVDNSISSSPRGVAIASSHALYMLDTSDDDVPRVLWRKGYDRGSARKPGQLSWGTGATPTFFGPKGSDEYVTITDNADEQEHLLVYKVSDGSLVCSAGVFARGASGTENSAMGHGRSVIVASTYGYPYPALPQGAGRSKPGVASFTAGGMERFEVAADGSGCRRVWSVPVLSSAVPRWSVADDTIYTIVRPAAGVVTGSTFEAVTVDPNTGAVTSRTKIARSALRDTLEMVGTITKDGVWWQGAMTGVFRMQAK